SAAERNIPFWTRLIAWDGLFQSEEGGGNGAPGFQNNTRVLTWDKQLWVKYSNGQWVRLAQANTTSGRGWRPNCRDYGGATLVTNGGNLDARNELGGTSLRTNPGQGTQRYWVPHMYYGLTTVDPSQIVAVLSTGKTALVLHNSSGPDDRDASRYLYHIGADW